MLKNYFDFNKKELNGALILVVILATIMIIYFVSPMRGTKIETIDEGMKESFAEFSYRLMQINDSIEKSRFAWSQNKNNVDFNRVDYSISKKELKPFKFDPNKATEADWTKMGLSDRQIKSIENYKSKGGKFRTKEDFRKMYSISDEEYEILEPYIEIAVDTTQKTTYTYAPKKIDFRFVQINLNLADTFDMQRVPGIGKALSTRIFKYRERLGGFYDYSQLFEVYGMDSSRVEKVMPYFKIDENEIRKININKAEISEMLKHPYIDMYIAKSIVVFREENGRFTRLEQLKETTLMYDELYDRVKRYIKLED